MKAVEFTFGNQNRLEGGWAPWNWHGMAEHEGRELCRRIVLCKPGEPLLVRYSTGQLCTFRRKTKGQLHE